MHLPPLIPRSGMSTLVIPDEPNSQRDTDLPVVWLAQGQFRVKIHSQVSRFLILFVLPTHLLLKEAKTISTRTVILPHPMVTTITTRSWTIWRPSPSCPIFLNSSSTKTPKVGQTHREMFWTPADNAQAPLGLVYPPTITILNMLVHHILIITNLPTIIPILWAIKRTKVTPHPRRLHPRLILARTIKSWVITVVVPCLKITIWDNNLSSTCQVGKKQKRQRSHFCANEH